MNFFEFTDVISTEEKIIEYLCENNLLQRIRRCEKCENRDMIFQKLHEAKDLFVHRCSKCKTKCSLRKGTFFEKSKLQLKTILSILYLLCADVKQLTIAEMLNINRKTVMDFANFLREEYTNSFLHSDFMLGGLGLIVQVNYAFFCLTLFTD